MYSEFIYLPRGITQYAIQYAENKCAVKEHCSVPGSSLKNKMPFDLKKASVKYKGFILNLWVRDE